MRTFYSLKTFFVMCVLCMTGTFCALAQTTVTFTAGTDVSSTTSITKDGVTILLTEGNSSSTIGPGKLDQTEYRFYKGSTVVVSSSKGNITKIVFNCTANNTDKYGPGCFEKQTGYSYASEKGTWVGDAASVEFTASSNQVRANTVEVTYVSSSTVTAPKISEDSKIFREPFDVTITAEDGADIYYTLDGSDPTASSAKYGGTAIHITETCTLKAIAVKNGESSEIATAIYTYKDGVAHDGTYASPLSTDEVIQRASEFNGKNVWVKGIVLGEAENSGYSELRASSASLALGEIGSTDNLPILLEKGSNERIYCNANYKTLTGKEIMFYGTINQRTGSGTGYYSRTGIKVVKSFSGTEDAPVSALAIKTTEGYATFVCDYEFYVPDGVVCTAITNASENGVLTTGHEFKADKIVPANYPVLVKAGGPKTFNLVIPSGGVNKPDETNLLKVGKGEDIIAETGHHYYKLAYDDFDTKEGLGFYWGAAEGGAFYVPKGNAYLDVPSASTTSVMSFRLEDAVTGIATTVVNGQTEKVAYTIDGRRVDASHLTKGIYIVNGKKVMVK